MLNQPHMAAANNLFYRAMVRAKFVTSALDEGSSLLNLVSRHFRHQTLASLAALSAICFAFTPNVVAEEFEDVEIRVIRPRYMTKRKKFELGTEMIAIMNQTFVYSFLGSGIINYHFTESFALELTGAYGFSIDKEDKRILDSEFDIQTQILRTKDFLEAAIAWTPIYGKYQLASGRLVYFDTFITVGGGLTGVNYTYDHCIPPEKLPANMRDSAPPVPSEKTVHYPSVVGGIGQRFFVSKSTSFKWDVKSHAFFYDLKDGDCNPETAESKTDNQINITLQLGASRFF